MGALLEYFGLGSGEQTKRTLLRVGPYLFLVGTGLLALSVAVQWLVPLSWWLHAAAIVLALLYLFLFLARLHHASADQGTGEGEEGGGPLPD
ncbi:MAG: hypothetical protein SCH98_11650 [Deferrisomatales bacterium]|nr:hypothetical protein [Deferrisomatales bacterium]